MAYFDNPHKKAMWEKELKGLQRDKEKNLTQQSEERTTAKANRINGAENRPYRKRITYAALIEKEHMLSGGARKSRLHDRKAERTKEKEHTKSAPERKAPERPALTRPALTLSAPRQM